MTDVSAVKEALKNWPQIRKHGENVIVPTFSVYPSGSIIEIQVQGGQREARVTDGGGAFHEIDVAGDFSFDAARVLHSYTRRFGVKRHGLESDKKGWIISPTIEISEISAWISLVSEASHGAAYHLLNKFKPRMKRNIREEVDRCLRSRFDDAVQIEPTIVGGSNKPRKFDFAVPLGSNRKLVVDAVYPDANSINAAVVSHIDLRNAHLDGVEQRIVYDETDDWKSSDLSMLEIAATSVAFNKMDQNIQRLLH